MKSLFFRFLSSCGFILLYSAVSLLQGCDFNKHSLQDGDLVIEPPQGQSSSSAGNLMTTAMAKMNDVDIVFYPAPLIEPSSFGVLKQQRTSSDIEAILDMFPDGPDDQFMVGTMRARDIQKFVMTRSEEHYGLELEVAGLKYHLHYTGGVRRFANFSRVDGKNFDESRVYRVAVSGKFFFSGSTFPGYKYRNSFNFVFNPTQEIISAKESLKSFLESGERLPYLNEVRAQVSTSVNENKGLQGIAKIQGLSHRSPIYGSPVTTVGVVTAVGQSEWYPRNIEVYIQTLPADQFKEITRDPLVLKKLENCELEKESLSTQISSKKTNQEVQELSAQLNRKSQECEDQKIKFERAYLATLSDEDDRTSEGLLLVFKPGQWDVQLGELLEVSGVVYEEILAGGLGRTSLREISKIDRIGTGPQPRAVAIGAHGRPIPDDMISTYSGNLNLKPYLTLRDGIDFWESLEGMRVAANNPRVVGFRGGKQDVNENKPKTYLNIYMVADGEIPFSRPSDAGGIMIDDLHEKYNPQIFQVITNHLTRGVNPNIILQVGDLIQGSLEGVVTYEKNIFGDGEYALVLPFAQSALDAKRFTGRTDPPPYTERPKTHLVASDSQLSVATFNLENLPGYDDVRLARVAEVIVVNLRCPDILNLVEIQDNNGTDFADGSSAATTLTKLISYIQVYAHKNSSPETAHCLKKDYANLNVNPIQNAEGGEPGGNIRVAMLYDKNKLLFSPRGNSSALQETVFLDNGSISPNPGRVFPNNQSFDNSRRSIIAEFGFRGKKVFVIGNHLASKLGDSSLWGENQPALLNSNKKRIPMAYELNKFVQLIKNYNADSRVIVLGDFNAFPHERSMRTLEGQELRNLFIWKDLLPASKRYTYNHNGNSQAIDLIFACFNLLGSEPKVQAVHINSDYMGRLSDHDPVVALFQF